MTEKQIKDLDYVRDKILFHTNIDVKNPESKIKNINARIIFSNIARIQYKEMNIKSIGNYLGKSQPSVSRYLRDFYLIQNYTNNYERYYYDVYKAILFEMNSEKLINIKKISKDFVSNKISKLKQALKEVAEALQIK
jgi:predicted transcriptional regulator